MLTSSGTPNVFNGTYLYLIDNTMKPYNLNETFEITLTVNGEKVCSGTYSFDAYIYNVNSKYNIYTHSEETSAWVLNGETTAGAGTVRAFKCALALKAFAMSAKEYMLK